MEQGRPQHTEESYMISLIAWIGLILLTIFLSIMTEFQIKRDGLIIGFEEHTKTGPVYWYNDQFNSREELPGTFPTLDSDTRVLVSEKAADMREEAR